MSRPATSVFTAPGLRRALGAAGLLAATFLSAGHAQAQEDGSFNLTNRSNRVIERLYASPVDSNQWGENRLRAGQTIENGANFAVRMPENGGCRTDIRVGFAGGIVEERRDIDTCQDRDVVIGTPARTGRGAGGEAPQAGRSGGGAGGSIEGGGTAQRGPDRGSDRGGAEQGDPTFVLLNQAASPVNEVYASPTSDDSWGEDRLGQNIIRPRGRQTIRLPRGECQYDLRVVWQDGRSEERRDINLCEMRELTVR